MSKNRLEAFSDGVIAIIITIMVLEIKTPETADLSGFYHVLPSLFGYFLSFAFVGIYWNNHHHLLHTVKKVTPAIMWANLGLLFWLSLVPFATKWMDESHFDTFPIVAYAVLLLLNGVFYNFLSKAIYASLEENDPLRNLLKIGTKAMASILLYTIAIPAAYLHTTISLLIFLTVSIIWVIPSKAIEKQITSNT